MSAETSDSKQAKDYQKPFMKDPVYPDVVKIEFGTEAFSSKATTIKHFKKDDVICKLHGTTNTVKAWTSVQIGRDSHIDLNSELVYLVSTINKNHSCDPSIKIDCENLQLIANKDLKPGDELTFFYPSTEWEMQQAFECWCGGSSCLKSIQGAKYIPKNLTKSFYFAKHIKELMAEQS